MGHRRKHKQCQCTVPGPCWILQQDSCGNLREVEVGIYMAEPYYFDRKRIFKLLKERDG